MAQDVASQMATRHYEGLKEYLGPSYISKDAPNVANPQRQSAREKLTKLTKQQFLELATDVYDEMNRRVYDAATVPFLAVREDYHPKRNQARQKLATLQLTRFKDLASDVFFEIERRFPHVTSSDSGLKPETQIPAVKQPTGNSVEGFQSNSSLNYTYSDDSKQMFAASKQASLNNLSNQQHSLSSKGVLVQGSNSDFGYSAPSFPKVSQQKPNPVFPTQISTQQHQQRPADAPSSAVPAVNFSNLDSLMADLGNMLETSGAEDKSFNNNAIGKRGFANTQAEDSDNNLVEMQKQIHRLEDKLAEAQHQIQTQGDTAKQLVALQTTHQKLQDSFAELKRQNDDLQDDFSNQQQMAKDIRQEASNLLEENKAMNRKNEELRMERDALLLEVKMLKQKLESGSGAAAVVSAAAVSVSNSSSNSPEAGGQPNLDLAASKIPIAPNGVVDHSHIIEYQQAVGDLLAASKSDAPTTVLVAMKAIVIACKNMTENIELYEASASKLSADERDQLSAIKNKISVALKSLMEAAKTHAAACSGGGAQSGKTEQDLRQALVYLSDTISDILRRVHVKGRTEAHPSDSKSVQNASPSNRLSLGEPVYDINELKAFLEKQTDAIVHAIQILLQAMRSQSSGLSSDFIQTVNSITSIVDNLVEISTKTIDTPAAVQFRVSGNAILDKLTYANRKLEELGKSITMAPASKNIKQDLASASYDIAKHVKELISLIE